MSYRRFLSGAALVSLALASSCSLLVETESTQCKPDSDDCDDLNADYPLECVAGLCVVAEGLECKTSAACRESAADDPRAPLICEKEQNVCVRAASCAFDTDCAKYSEHEDNICIGDACQPAQCQKPADCTKDPDFGDGFECQANRCVEPVWGCIGEDDNRPDDGKPAEFQLQVITAPAPGDTPLVDFKVTVCSGNDIPCMTPLAKYSGADTKDIQYDTTTGWLTVKNVLENGKKYSLLLSGTNPLVGQPVLDGQFVMQRAMMNVTIEPRPVVMFIAGVREGFSEYADPDEEIDGPNTGLLFARLFDCGGKQLPGVSISTKTIFNCQKPDTNPDDEIEPKKCTTKTIYFDSTNKPQVGRTETDLAGRAGMVNMTPDLESVISCTRKLTDQTYTSVSLYPRPGWVTYSHIYPRKTRKL